MRKVPATDPLDLWRGIDDAIMREARRPQRGQPPTLAIPKRRAAPVQPLALPTRADGKALQPA
jgi:hypothetical protein